MAEQHGHAAAAGALKAAIQRQKRMIELGIGEDDKEEGEEGGGDVLAATMVLPLRSPLASSSGASMGTTLSASQGVSGSGGGGTKLLGKAQQLLDKADTFVSGVVLRGGRGAGAGGQGKAEGAKEMLEDLWMERG